MITLRRLSFAVLVAALPMSMPVAHAQTPRIIEITAAADLKFSVTTINAKPGEALRIRLKAVGPAMPKAVMQHNVVILKSGSDPKAFGTAAMSAAATNYIPAALKAQVIAASGLVGNGETVDLNFTAPKVAGSYPFLCSFLGHFTTMNGTLVVGK